MANAVAGERHDAQRQMRHRKTAVITGDGFRGNLNPSDEVDLRNVEFAIVDGDVDVRTADDESGSHLRRASTEGTRCREQGQEYNEDLETRQSRLQHADLEEIFPTKVWSPNQRRFFFSGRGRKPAVQQGVHSKFSRAEQ